MRRSWSARSAIATRCTRLLREHGVDTVMHFAAYTIVPESVQRAAEILRQQHLRHAHAAGMLCRAPGCATSCSPPPPRCMASRPTAVAAESTPTAPINPYGTSKLMSEWMLRDLAQRSAAEIRRAALLQRRRLRPEGRIGQATPERDAAGEGRLRGRGRQARRGLRSSAPTTPTPDGTGVRDYIHVEDLATAHLDALDYLRGGGASTDAQLRLRPWLQRARGARERGAGGGQAPDGARAAAPRRRSAGADRPCRAHPRGAGLAAALR